MKRPELHHLADIAQIVGALGVIVSLIYVAAEVRQNTNAVRAATFQEMVAMTVQLRSELVTDPTFAALAVKASADPASLTPPEAARMDAWIAAVLRQFENLHYQHRAGMLDPGLWKGYDQMIRHSLSNVALQSWYRAHRLEYSEEFAAYVDSVRGR
jgi:hypothetical protein